MAHARNTDPQTSHEAAESVKHLTQTQMGILNILSVALKPMSDEEIVERYQAKAKLGLMPMASVSGIRSRRNELAVLGKIAVKGYDKTWSGRRCSLWGVTND
jgi:hypothetical protein